MADLPTLWHYTLNAPPRVAEREDGLVDLHLPLGTWAPSGVERTIVALDWAVNGGPAHTVEALGPSVADAVLTRIDGDFIAARKAEDASPPTRPRRLAQRPYTLMSQKPEDTYYEAVVGGLSVGCRVEYTFRVRWANGATAKLGPFHVLASSPSFSPENVVGGRLGGRTSERFWIGHVQRDGDWTHVRVDLDDISGRLPDVRIVVGEREFDVAKDPLVHAERLPWLPFIDPYADTVTVSVPDSAGEAVSIEVDGRQMVVDEPWTGRTRLLFAHFAIQGLNDLFETPTKKYDPPRTYMQITMRDECGVVSSRPGRPENHDPDGYIYGVYLHRRFGVPYHLVVNGGLLALIAHDCPEDLDGMRQDVTDGLMHPGITGFGSHRIPYFAAETNQHDLDIAMRMNEAYLGKSGGDLFYPDQRLYKGGASEKALLTEPVRYLVADASAGYDVYKRSIRTNKNAEGVDLGPSMLWQDESTGVHLLFIDDELRGSPFDGSQSHLGKPSLALRRRLMRHAIDPALRTKNLLTYGDDFDKACGNGWFDGLTGFGQAWSSFLEWISAHGTWLQAVTTADLDPSVDCVGTIDLRSSTCPSVDPGGAESLDLAKREMHFDTWHDVWYDHPGLWLGKSLGDVSQEAEQALLTWPQWAHNELYELAWMSFLTAQHENCWNKQALEGGDPNRKPVGEPEDFIITASLQVRNTHVWLAASVWADWAHQQVNDQQYVDDGPVLDLVRELGADPHHWDRDPLPTIAMYNRHALVVVDRNGGRITHAFVMRDGRPRAVSGTFNCYQYRATDLTDCDGEMLQNTVWTPNHGYIACDTDLSRATQGTWQDERPEASPTHVRRVVPDNFNAYRCERIDDRTVECTFAHGEKPRDVDKPEFETLIRQDGDNRREGRNGVVWHDPDVPPFTKRLRLDGTGLHVTYTGARAGHVVGNEISVDLLAGILDPAAQITRHPSPSGREVSLVMPSRGGVTISAGEGCEITPLSLLASPAQAATPDEQVATMALHRLLADTVQLRSTSGELFSYSIELRA